MIIGFIAGVVVSIFMDSLSGGKSRQYVIRSALFVGAITSIVTRAITGHLI